MGKNKFALKCFSGKTNHYNTMFFKQKIGSLTVTFFLKLCKNIFVSFKLTLLAIRGSQSCQTTTQTQQYPFGVSYKQSQNNWVVTSQDVAKVLLKDSEHMGRFLQKEVEQNLSWVRKVYRFENIFFWGGVHCSRHDQNLWLFQSFETATFWLTSVSERYGACLMLLYNTVEEDMRGMNERINDTHSGFLCRFLFGEIWNEILAKYYEEPNFFFRHSNCVLLNDLL